MIARIVASIMTGKLLKAKHKDKPNGRVLKKAKKNKDQSGVDAADSRKFPEVLADIQKKTLDL